MAGEKKVKLAGSNLVEKQYFTFAHPPDELVLESGEKLGPITVAYETMGKLKSHGKNAILITHGLTGDSHSAGKYSPKDPKVGWWDQLIGSGKVFDTEKYFVVTSNVLGGCQGTNGPASLSPETGKPYGTTFPLYTIRDMVKVQAKLLEHLGVKGLATVAGGSMGGMQVLEWAVMYPDLVRSVIPMATAGRYTAQAIAWNEIKRRTIMLDPHWNNGDYYGKWAPNEGLAIARMLGTVTYKCEELLEERFGRGFAGETERDYFDMDKRFDVENYLHYHGDSLVKRFDANCYLYLTKAMDLHDIAFGRGSFKEALERIKAKVMVMGFTSDFLFPTWQQKELVSGLKELGKDAEYVEIETDQGHDAFLVEFKKMIPHIKSFLKNVSVF